MTTCVSQNCPYMDYCRFYNFKADRGERCIYRAMINHAAKQELAKEKRSNKT